MPSLANDIRQVFAHSVLSRFNRLDEADVRFTFVPGDVYLSAFAEALEHIDARGFVEKDQELLAYAQVFERFVVDAVDYVDPSSAAMLSSAFYWLSGYSANALVIARTIRSIDSARTELRDLLLKLLAREDLEDVGGYETGVDRLLVQYMLSGDEKHLSWAIEEATSIREGCLARGTADDFVSAHLLIRVLRRLGYVSFWTSVHRHASAPQDVWQAYIRHNVQSGTPILDLWPSQRSAISKGLLDGESSVVIRMPTSSGKTKMTELAFINDLHTDPDRRCLYLAPYRALVSEVEHDIGHTLGELGLPVASLYGGAEANELEVELTDIARVIIATPEKISAVLKLSGGSLSDFQTIVLDEGHLIDSCKRGTAFELQLASLRQELAEVGRAVFLSAVLPNSSEIASWLGETTEALADENWQPTSMRLGVVTWPKDSSARLAYLIQTGQTVTDGFFVPRLLEEDRWQEIYPETGRLRTYRFPERGDNGKIAAALAFEAARSGPVIIYATRPDWVNSIARKVNRRIRRSRPIETNLIDESNQQDLAELAEYLEATLGAESSLPEAVANGFALHHSGIPQRIRLIIEDAFRQQTLKLLIATNTIAQGVNFPAKTVIVHSFPYTDAPIRDFWNLVGRAGRALKETEGEVLILATGNLKPSTLNRFLDQGKVERVDSQIFLLVRELVQRYPSVSPETIAMLLNDPEGASRWSPVVRAVDAHLLEIMAEDLAADETDPNLEPLTRSLFATHQASIYDLTYGTELQSAIADFMKVRHASVFERVPEGLQRQRYARTGLSVESSLALDDRMDLLREILTTSPNLGRESFADVMSVACNAQELAEASQPEVSTLGYHWIQSGRYDVVYSAIPGLFDDFDDAVGYVEDLLCYRVPWVLNGLIRLLDTQEETEGELGATYPPWIYLLPDYLRYGVDSEELVWVMSLGFGDPRFADWLLQRFIHESGRNPHSFREFVDWALQTGLSLEEEVESAWPAYFSRLLQRVLERYSRLNQLLNA